MKFINQRDYPHWLYITRTDMESEEDRERGKTTTVFTSACGLCSAVMVADRLLPNCDFSLSDAIDLSYAVKANYRRGTSYQRFAPAFAEKVGLRMETAWEMQALMDCLRTGGAAVAWVAGDRDDRVGVFSHVGHYIAVIGVERDGRLAVLDPYLYEGKFQEEGRVGKVELKNGVIALCQPETLQADVVNKSFPYYLFWRK
jgi:hypothetical protein